MRDQDDQDEYAAALTTALRAYAILLSTLALFVGALMIWSALS